MSSLLRYPALRLLESAQTADGKNSSLGASVGVGVSVGAQTGFYAYAEVGGSKGKNHYLAQTHDHTTLEADNIQLASQGDTTLRGATATANRIDADVKGRLNIESVQDHIEQENKQSSAGARVQVSFGTAWEASGNFSQSKASGSSDTVSVQSGLFAGDGGYHINADSVHLKGGAIVSIAPKEQNELTANRFTFENIQNQSSYSASNVGLSGGYGQNPDKEPGYTDGSSFSPSLPQYEKGGDNSITYATLSEGRLNIAGKDTTVQELGIHSDSSSAHRAVAALPDLAKITEKQQIVAKATTDIVSAARTFSGNRQKAAAEDKAKAEAEFEGRLKAQNDGSYEAFSRLSDSERQAVLISESEAYRKADTEAQNWGIGGSKSRAVNAGTILLTGILGGKTNLQTAANTLSPYAAAAIGNTFGHGENKNETAQLVGHFVLGATLAYINGGDPLSGGGAAVAAEKAAQYLTQQYNDGKTAIDPQTGEFNPNLLPEHIKEEIKSTTGVIAAIVGATGDGGAALNAQIGGVLGQNAVENNRFLRPINTNVGRTTQNPNQPRYRNLPLQSTPLSPQQIANVRRLNQLENEIRQLEPNFKGLPDHQIGSPGSSYVPYTNARVAQYQNYLTSLQMRVAPSNQDIVNRLIPNGNYVGVRYSNRTKNFIRSVPSHEFNQIETLILRGATKGETYSRGTGQWYNLPSGGRVGVRQSSENGRTLDIEIPNLPRHGMKIHIINIK